MGWQIKGNGLKARIMGEATHHAVVLAGIGARGVQAQDRLTLTRCFHKNVRSLTLQAKDVVVSTTDACPRETMTWGHSRQHMPALNEALQKGPALRNGERLARDGELGVTQLPSRKRLKKGWRRLGQSLGPGTGLGHYRDSGDAAAVSGFSKA